MQNRLPDNVHVLQSLHVLTPETVIGMRKPKLQELSFLAKYSGDIGKLDEQWQRIETIAWPKEVIPDVEKFCRKVYEHQDASGERDFREVAQFVLSLLSLPISNASVERVFSQMNLIKSKIRNRMQQKSLESILHVSAFMQRNDICCNKFVPSESMLSSFTQDIYSKHAVYDDADTLDIIDL
ncbi:hypothetical protein Pcinc_030998 [Petrolisthes cinctipes]|uniref:HAT C-terminal dimerisation domain-containing protein n=1 Tax=Petrolisthes cinctipes TaxID=88211 RepID=A0AAE1EY45_PETCI|nr:hypothetical protein Pcinc_030998 [Petrolisthes cinctipes]